MPHIDLATAQKIAAAAATSSDDALLAQSWLERLDAGADTADAGVREILEAI